MNNAKPAEYYINKISKALYGIVQWGKIAELDAEKAVAKVQIGELKTGWLPWVTRRAGNDIDWWAPEVGERVIILSPGGKTEVAVILGSVYQKDFPAPGSLPSLHTVIYKDGTTFSYNRKKHEFKFSISEDSSSDPGIDLTAKADGTIKIVAKSDIAIETEGVVEVTTKDNVTVMTEADASIEAKGNVAVNTNGDATVDAKGNVTLKAAKDAMIESTNLSLKATGSVTIEGQKIDLKGTLVNVE